MIRPYFKIIRQEGVLAIIRQEGVLAPWDVPDLLAAYGFQRGSMKGSGRRPVGIIEFGGTSFASDFNTYCSQYGIVVPEVTNVGMPFPSDPGGADVEVALDMQVMAAATDYLMGTASPIRMYWAADFDTAIRQAANDGCSVLSISWGQDEVLAGEATVWHTQAAAWYAVQKGCLPVAATGDNDSSDGGPTPANVDYPSCCASVWAVGGTTKPHNGQEIAWGSSHPDGNGTGGGYDIYLPFQPNRQKGAPQPPAGLGRMVPDSAAVADPQTGYMIFVGGQWQAVGGTSGAAPLTASILAAMPRPRLGLYMQLWEHPECFVDITQGTNGVYSAATGPDPVSGLGVPNGAKLSAFNAEIEDWQIIDSVESFNAAIRVIGDRVKAGAEARPKGSYFEPLGNEEKEWTPNSSAR